MPATRSLHDCQALATAVVEAGGVVPNTIGHLLAGAALLAGQGTAQDPSRAILAAAVAGELTEKKLNALIADAAQAQQINEYRGQLRRDSETLFTTEIHRALADGGADAVLDSLRPAWDKAAEKIAAARALIDPESSPDHILSSGEPATVSAWQGLNADLAVVGRIAAIASQFGPRTGNFPLIKVFGLADNFRLEDRAVMTTDGPLPVDSGLFRTPDRGHRTSPFFRLPLRLHSIESAQARYNAWAATEFDRIHGGSQESVQGEDGQFHERPRPVNPFRREEVAAT